MRSFRRLHAAVLCGGAGLMLTALQAHAQVNPEWNLPNDGTSGTDTTAQTDGNNIQGASTGWYMSPAPNPDFGYTNNGMRDTFFSLEPSGWSFWIQTFTQSGFASQPIAASAGTNYTFSSQFSFQDGSGPGMGYNATTLANQTEASPPAPNSGDLFSYIQIKYENASGGVLATDTTKIAAGSVTTYAPPGSQINAWAPYSASGLAPAGTTQALLTIGWQNGGLDGGTGAQSAFADDAVFAPTAVPEPASIGLISLGGLALLGRRRRAKTA